MTMSCMSYSKALRLIVLSVLVIRFVTILFRGSSIANVDDASSVDSLKSDAEYPEGPYLEGPYESICGKIPYERSTELQRLVVFVGPHKTGISSIQTFFSKFTEKYSNGDWVFPFDGKSFPLAMRVHHKCNKRKETLQELSKRTKTASNVMVAAEYFDKHPGFGKLTDVISFFKPKKLDIVAHFRQPRAVQWISVWKELVQTAEWSKYKDKTYQQWLCSKTSGSNDFETWGMRATNILGVIAHNYSTLGGKVTLIDLAGVKDAERDISHVVACDILGWNCTEDGWINGMQRTPSERKNVRRKDPSLTELQYNNTEWLFRQRDCLSYQSIRAKKNVQVLQPTNAFLEACPSKKYYPRLADYDYFLKLLQRATGCDSEEIRIPDLIEILEEE